MASGSFQATIGWQLKLDVTAGASQDSITTQTQAMMQTHAQQSWIKVCQGKNITDASLDTVAIQVNTITPVTRVNTANPLIAWLAPSYKYQTTVTGTTIFQFHDDIVEAAIIVAGLAALVATLVFAPELLIVLGPTVVLVIIGIEGVVVLAATYVEAATGTANAINLATSTPAGSIVTIIIVIVVAIVALVLLVPGLSGWLKKKLDKEKY